MAVSTCTSSNAVGGDGCSGSLRLCLSNKFTNGVDRRPGASDPWIIKDDNKLNTSCLATSLKSKKK